MEKAYVSIVWEKKKMLVNCIFSFCIIVAYSTKVPLKFQPWGLYPLLLKKWGQK